MKKILLLCVVAVCLLTGCSQPSPDANKGQPTDKSKAAADPTESDPRIKKVKDRIAQQSQDCKDAIEKVKNQKLTINGAKSAVGPGVIADRFAKQPSNIGIGWEAFKNPDGIYDVWYHFRNSKGDVIFSKWSYNSKTGDVKPANEMALQFSYASQ